MILSVRSLTVFEENIVVTVFKLVPLFFQSLIAGEGGGEGWGVGGEGWDYKKLTATAEGG